MTSNKIMNLTEAKDAVMAWKNERQCVVFTNGCFDILHLGHIDFHLEKAGVLYRRQINHWVKF